MRLSQFPSASRDWDSCAWNFSKWEPIQANFCLPHSLAATTTHIFVHFFFMCSKRKGKNKTSPLGMIVFFFLRLMTTEEKEIKSDKSIFESRAHNHWKSSIFLFLFFLFVKKRPVSGSYNFRLSHTTLTPCRFFTYCKKHLQNCALDGERKERERKRFLNTDFFSAINVLLPYICFGRSATPFIDWRGHIWQFSLSSCFFSICRKI